LGIFLRGADAIAPDEQGFYFVRKQAVGEERTHAIAPLESLKRSRWIRK